MLNKITSCIQAMFPFLHECECNVFGTRGSKPTCDVEYSEYCVVGPSTQKV